MLTHLIGRSLQPLQRFEFQDTYTNASWWHCSLAEHMQNIQETTPHLLDDFCAHELTNSILVGGLEHEFYFPLWDVILPIDFHIFQRGWNHQPVYQ